MSASCARCGRAEPVSLRRETVRALLHWHDHAVDERPLCAACSRAAGTRALVTTGLLGWWGWPGLRRAPGAVVRTVRHLSGAGLPSPLAWGFGGAALIVPLVAVLAILAGVARVMPEDPAAAVRRAERFAGEAQAHLRRGQFDAALAKFRAALEQTPGMPDYAYGAGMAAGNAGRPAEAEGWLVQAVTQKLPEREFKYELALGRVQLKLGKAGAAVATLERAAAMPEAGVAAHRDLQDALRAAGKLPDAVARYAARLRDAPQSADACYLVARLTPALPDRIALLERGLQSAPGHFWCLLALGAAHIEAGRPAQAIPVLERAVAADRGAAKARFTLLRAQLQAGRRDEARRTLQTLRTDFPGTHILAEAEKLAAAQ